ncbi:MAG: hypothetical protein JW918_03055 [Anaerolineae bacterium]|nr:hypothetical protein [Anaerolineae bacterium]
MDETVRYVLTALGILALPCLGALTFIAFVVVGILLARKHRQRWDEAWVEVARRTGLTYASKTLEQLGQEAQQQAAMEPPGKRRLIRVAPPTAPPRLVGHYRGFDVVVDVFTRDFGDDILDERRFTRVMVPVRNREDCRLAIRRRRFLSPDSALKAPEVRVSAVGEGDFERRFVVQGDPEYAVARLFADGSLAQRLAEEAAQYEVRLENQEVRLVAKGLEIRPDVLPALLDLAVDLAARVDRG